MPQRNPKAFKVYAHMCVRLQLGQVQNKLMQAPLSARSLATDNEEADKVRPHALKNFHGRHASKEIGRTFQLRVGAALDPIKHLLAGNRSA